MTRRGKKINYCEDGNDTEKSRRKCVHTDILDHEIAQLTKLRSGPQGFLGHRAPGKFKLPVSTVKMIFGRESNHSRSGRFSLADSCHLLSRYLPIKGPQRVDSMNGRVYVSQFSADGTLFVAGSQGSQIRIYNVERGWEIKKNILTKNLRWTITDTSLSPDQRFLVYSSLSPVVHIVNVGSSSTESLANITEIHDGLDFAAEDDDQFGIFSVKFSTDGRELVAASNDNSIYVYDVEAKLCTIRIPAHKSDVNTVCFADETGHLLYSGSDDHLCKVWDRRCFVTRGQAAGVLVGHLQGVTFIDSRADGRYFISNGKDQTTKLWDIRKMFSKATYIPRLFRYDDFDYGWMEYPSYARTLKHPHDMSLATYRGHSVLRTLIRCYFSPVHSTGQKYVYTGSAESSVHIYDLVSGAEVARLNHQEGPIRDCSWHPFYPMIVSSSWDGEITRWEFPGISGQIAHCQSNQLRLCLLSGLCLLFFQRTRKKLMATSSAKVTFRLLIAMVVLVVLFYVGRPLYWKISATVHDIRHNKQTVREGISQIVYEAQKSVGWYHDESDSGIREDRAKKAVVAAARRLLLVKVL